MLIAWFIIVGLIALFGLIGLIADFLSPAAWAGALTVSASILTALIIFEALGVV